MDDACERRCLIALHLTPALGGVRIARLIRALGSAEAVCGASGAQLASVPGMTARLAALIVEWRRRADVNVDRELARAAACRARVVTWLDRGYPAALRGLPDAPPVVYLRGAWDGGGAPAAAVVGTRRASGYGLEIAAFLGEVLGRAGATVISGLARGIDGAAHRGALRGEGVTVGVLGCGVDVTYPAEHRSLMEEMQRSGAVMAEVRLGTPPRVQQFPRRNRLISALARAVVVVEGDVDSGAMITAHYATAQGRPVFAVPGSVHQRTSRGPHRLLAQGARILADPKDLLAALGLTEAAWRGWAPQAAAARGASSSLPERMGRILAVLDEYGVHIDAIVAQTGLSPAEAAGILSALEVRGLVRVLPGTRYARCAAPGTSRHDPGGCTWPNHSSS